MSRKIHEGELRVQGKGVTVRGGLKECLLGYTIAVRNQGRTAGYMFMGEAKADAICLSSWNGLLRGVSS